RPVGESGPTGCAPAPRLLLLEVAAVTCSTVSEYTYECEYPESGPANARRVARGDARGTARCGWSRVRRARLRGRERRGDRRRGRLHARRVLLELRVQGAALRGAAAGARLQPLPRDRAGQRRRERVAN